MFLAAIQLFLLVNFTPPVIEEYKFEREKICYVLDLGIKVKENNFKSNAEIYNRYINCIYHLFKIKDDGREKINYRIKTVIVAVTT